jgi:hypothetical protein
MTHCQLKNHCTLVDNWAGGMDKSAGEGAKSLVEGVRNSNGEVQ